MSNGDWDTKAAWMRRVGATAATWSDQTLTSATLGPDPSVAMETQQPISADEYAKRQRDERRRLAMASSGGPVRPPGGDAA